MKPQKHFLRTCCIENIFPLQLDWQKMAMIIVSATFILLLFERLEPKFLDLGVTSTSKDVGSTGEVAETMIKAQKILGTT